MNDKDRIRLAEAMGEYDPSATELFNPFYSADDDYAVLEWMRSKKQGLPAEFLVRTWATYQIGDYAKACLRVLDEQ